MSEAPRSIRSIAVRAYAGSSGEEEPRSFELAGSHIEILEILERWREPSGRFFRVLGGDGRKHLLHCSEPGLEWTLRM